MKKALTIIILFFLNIELSYSQGDSSAHNEISTLENKIAINWEESFTEAKEIAKQTNKPILIYFTGSDWCGPCIKMDKNLFHTQKFYEYSNKNLVLYMANFPRNKDLVKEEARNINNTLSTKYNHQNKFPTLVMINHKGEVLGEKQGMYMLDYYYPFFEEVVKKYY